MKNKIDKLKLLDSLSKLQKADALFKNLSIADDMTLQEREEVKKLVMEAKNLKSTDEQYKKMKFRIKQMEGQFQIKWLRVLN